MPVEDAGQDEAVTALYTFATNEGRCFYFMERLFQPTRLSAQELRLLHELLDSARGAFEALG